MELGWVWIGVLVASVVIELITDDLVSIWFAPAAVISTLLDFLKVDIVWQILVFLAVALLGIFLVRRFVTKKLRVGEEKTNIEAIIGQKCVVTERIDNYAGCGQAKVNGQIWSARGCNDEDVFEVGEILRIVAIEGVKIICKR